MPAQKTASEAAVREQAYYFWEQDGRPEGREAEYWMRAAGAVGEKSQTDAPTKAVKKAPKVAAGPVAVKPAKLKAGAPKLKGAAKTAPSKTDGKAKPKKK